MKRILFVDDDPNTLNGLRRGLYSMRHEWRLEFRENARDALRLLATTPMDVVVSDVHMPEMDGLQLLRQAKKTCPRAARIVLSGQTQPDQLARSFQSVHLFLSKPCDMQLLKRRIRQVVNHGEEIPDGSLKSLISRIGAVPSLPLLARKLQEEFQSPSPNVEEIASIVSMDIGMSASVLHVANSGYFRANVPLLNPAMAVRWLGAETVRSFLVTHGMRSSLETNGFKYFDAAALWQNSIERGNAARAAALAGTGDPVLADEAFAAGLFQDIGQIILATILRRSYDDIVLEARLRGEPLWQVESELIGVTHAQVGAYLLSLWGLPQTVLDAVMFHHSGEESPAELSPAMAGGVE
jgi:HD-like signal output (HDOD) protein/CheY-like chemotaxis protein